MKCAAAAALTLMAMAPMVSCNDDSTIGGSLVSDSLEVVIDSSFTVTGHTIAADPILSRTTMQLLGSVDVPGFGTLSSDFVTQFMPANAIDTAGITVAQIDSLRMFMVMNLGAYTGDSIAPMGLGVYRLTDELETPIYSTFNVAGKYDPNALAKKIYSYTVMGDADSLKTAKYRQIIVNLPVSLGRELFSAYVANPANYSTPTAFASNVFKGIYVKTTYGSGRLSRIEQPTMRMYYHTTVKDSLGRDSILRYVGNYFAVTPEIITNNNIKLDMAQNLKDRASQGQTLIVAPSGYNAQLTFPTREIISRYKNNITNLGVINLLTFTLPAIEIANDHGITPPPTLLLIQKSKFAEFFRDNKLTDSKTSFYANYNEDTKSYTFSGMRDYLIDMMKKEQITDDDCTFYIVPVDVVTETNTDSSYGSTSTVVKAINPYVTTPVMVQLDLSKARVTLTYTKQSLL